MLKLEFTPADHHVVNSAVLPNSAAEREIRWANRTECLQGDECRP